MKKIKKFKLKLNYWNIERLLKKNIPAYDTQLSTDIIKPYINKIVAQLEPALVYETMSVKDLDLKLFSQEQITKKTVAITLFIFNLGDKTIDVMVNNDTQVDKAVLYNSVLDDAVRQTTNFLLRLVKDEAEKEECELSEKQIVSDINLCAYIAEKLDITKIGVLPGNKENINGLTTGYLVWYARKKK